MKKLLLAIALIATCAFGTQLRAQNADNKNAIGVAAMWNDFQSPIENTYFFEWGQKRYGQEFWYARYLSPSFNLRIPVSIGTINYPNGAIQNKMPINGYSESIGATLDAQLLYKLNNGYILKENAAIAPYLYLGVAAVGGMWNRSLEKNYDMYLPFGAGLSLNFSEQISGIVEAEYRRSLALDKHNLIYKVGVSFAFGKPRDRDRDGISDKDDKCPDVPGLAKFNGCPDTDGDGITDAEDKCPQIAGVLALQGCPDKDGDGITDADDKCPDIAGIAALQGCPDKDGDGITDADDKCPDVAGLAAMAGCPDKDGDGITDADDRCPDVAGLASMAGCPDSDGDGIADKDDKCPKEKGIAALQGCPAPVDTDSDGIADKDDKCPKEKGTAALQGCPAPTEKDTDGDGIADVADRCPTEAGSRENFGCPIKKEVSFSFDNILFETGKSIIKKESYETLDQVVSIMKGNAKHLAAIQGHTDNQGNAATNQKLSETRAKACLDYLVSKGIAANRLTSVGFGDKSPVSDNTTVEGRTRNRRVEFKLSLPQ